MSDHLLEFNSVKSLNWKSQLARVKFDSMWFSAHHLELTPTFSPRIKAKSSGPCPHQQSVNQLNRLLLRDLGGGCLAFISLFSLITNTEPLRHVSYWRYRDMTFTFDVLCTTPFPSPASSAPPISHSFTGSPRHTRDSPTQQSSFHWQPWGSLFLPQACIRDRQLYPPQNLYSNLEPVVSVSSMPARHAGSESLTFHRLLPSFLDLASVPHFSLLPMSNYDHTQIMLPRNPDQTPRPGDPTPTPPHRARLSLSPKRTSRYLFSDPALVRGRTGRPETQVR